jgi:nucleolar MIF4G domain-containing protein 1
VQQREIVRVALHCCGNVSLLPILFVKSVPSISILSQEKQYNPYYALVCQHLCRTSYSHKITLQFWLWDFLRDLGESKVGGAEVIKNLKQDEGGFELKSISPTRLRNVARAYGWWIAKDCVGLSILKASAFIDNPTLSSDIRKDSPSIF